MIGDYKGYPELPVDWTIGVEEHFMPAGSKPYFYGLNRKTGEETIRFKSYGEALNAVEHKEWIKQK